MDQSQKNNFLNSFLTQRTQMSALNPPVEKSTSFKNRIDEIKRKLLSNPKEESKFASDEKMMPAEL